MSSRCLFRLLRQNTGFRICADLVQTPYFSPIGTPGAGKFHFGLSAGREAKPHSRPYMVSFQIGGRHKCGGALISEQWVLTVAHCFPNISLGPVTVVLGLHRLDVRLIQHQVVSIKGYFPHPDFEDISKENDIMLLQLSRNVELNDHVGVLQLPETAKQVSPGTVCSVAGWGSHKYNGPTAKALQEMTVRVLDNRVCNDSKYWNGEITSTMMCLQVVEEGTFPCQGDSGDPVVCMDGVIEGLISYSFRGCNDKSKPPVATAVSKFLEWIKITAQWPQ